MERALNQLLYQQLADMDHDVAQDDMLWNYYNACWVMRKVCLLA